MLLQVTVGGRGRDGVRAILGPGRGARSDQIPRDVVAAQATMFLQLLFGPGQRVAGHRGPVHHSKLGLRRELAELAFLGGEPVGVRPGRVGFFLGRESRAVFLLHGVQAGEKLTALFQAAVARLQAVDFRTDFRRSDGELHGFLHSYFSNWSRASAAVMIPLSVSSARDCASFSGCGGCRFGPLHAGFLIAAIAC